MKRSDIRNAYDSMGPTPEQRDRMYSAIIKASGKRNSRYQAQSTRQRRWGWIPAAAAVIFIAVMGVFVLGRSGNEDITLSPDVTQPVETEAIPPVHQELLNVYRTAIKENWTAEQCQENGISVRFADTEYAKENAAYVLLDIDGNGVKELIIGHGMPHYFYVWDLYAFDNNNGEPVQLHSDRNNGTNCHIYANGIIGVEYSGKTEGYYYFYGLHGSVLVKADLLRYKDDLWYNADTKEKISLEEAHEILGKYDMLDVEPTYLMDVPSYLREGNESVERYMLILEKYKTALAENWSWEQCDQADISRQIMFDTTNKNDLGWCLMDLDENGVQELVISDGVYLFDLYTLMPTDNSTGHLLSAYPNHYTLCKDGTIEQRENVQAVNTYWRWFRLSGIDFVQEGVVFFEGEKHQYSYGTSDDNLKKISENEAGKYLVNTEKAAMNLKLTPFVEKEFPEVREPNFYYESLIETYRTAIEEHWDPGKCIENGISLMVGYYGGIVTQLGHNQMDLNGDGNDELIITDGTNIYDLYTIISDEEVGPLRLIDATERSRFFLTTDGYIYNTASGSAMLSYYYLFNVGQRGLELDKAYKFDASVDPDNPWSYYDGMNQEISITTEEAAAAMDAIHFADVSYIPFNVRIVQGEPVVTQLPLEALEVLAAMPQGSYGYAEHIAWLIPWRDAEFDNPPPLYYCLHDWNEDGIIDMILGYEDSVLSVWSYMYDKNSKTEHLTLLTLSDEEYTELDKAWLKMDIRNITEFELN